MTVRPRPGPHQQHDSAFDRAVARLATDRTDQLRSKLDRAAANRRAVGDDEAARLAQAWADELRTVA